MPATGLTWGEAVRTELVGEFRTFPLLAGLDEDDLAGIANEFEEHVADAALLEPFASPDAAREVWWRERLARVEAELVVAA